MVGWNMEDTKLPSMTAKDIVSYLFHTGKKVKFPANCVHCGEEVKNITGVLIHARKVHKISASK